TATLTGIAGDGLEAAGVKLQQMVYVVFRFLRGGGGEAGGGRGGAAGSGGGGDKLEQVEGDVFVAARATGGVLGLVHVGSPGDFSDWDAIRVFAVDMRHGAFLLRQFGFYDFAYRASVGADSCSLNVALHGLHYAAHVFGAGLCARSCKLGYGLLNVMADFFFAGGLGHVALDEDDFGVLFGGEFRAVAFGELLG